jgi:hypothetical protein
MKLVQSDSPEVTNGIASTGVLASWGWSVWTLVCIASAPGLLIAVIVSLTVSVRAAAWIGIPIVLALNGYLLWRGRPRRFNWVIAGCADQVFVRLFVQRGRSQDDVEKPDVIVLEASEIASMSARIVEVFLYGPKPRFVEWLAIEFPQVIAQGISNHIRPLLIPDNPNTQIYVTDETGCLTMNWEWCRPHLQAFLQHVVRECPSVLVTPEKRSELDLNGIWHGIREEPNAEQRKMLVQAVRLGFGCKCAELLSLHRSMPIREARAYLAQIEREETGGDHSVECSSCRF